MPRRRTEIPLDASRAAKTDITAADWNASQAAHDRFKGLLETKPTAKARYDAVLAEINERQATLTHLRGARELTQSAVARRLDMDQSEVSRLERRTDVLLSTLRRLSKQPAARCTSS